MEGKQRAAENEHRDRAWLAWTTAALGRAQKMPKLNDLLGPGRRDRAEAERPKHWEELWAIARTWAAVTTGPETAGGADVDG